MRLGLRPTVFEAGTESSKLRRLYGSKEVAWERHRHRYEVEPKYVDELESKGGLRFVGKDERGERMQMLELDGECLLPRPSIISFERNLTARPPILRRFASAPRVLLSTPQSLSCLPRSRCRGLFPANTRGAARQ